MRPQQQNRRMRGRGSSNGGRKGPNPLNRSYESNGPDVKIRGTAQQVADKYSALARDAQSTGDRVMAENYLQHAEHYNRIIATAQAQQQNQTQQPNRDNREDAKSESGERDGRDQQEYQDDVSSADQSQKNQNDGSGPQPVIDGVPVEVALKESERHGANGAASDGQDTAAKANGAAKAAASDTEEEAKPAQAGDGESAAAESEPEEKPKPKRTRRPRTKKTAEPSEDGTSASQSDEAKGEEATTAAE